MILEQQETTLSSRVVKTAPVQWRQFSYIQQGNFKDISPEAMGKLKKSILDNQFTQPFYVWENPKDGVLYCLDGRHRTLAMEEMSKEGVNIPEELPATFISCVDKQEAARLVLIYSSIYAKVSQEGLFDFITAYELNFDDMKLTMDLPEFDSVVFAGMIEKDVSIEPVIPVSLSDKFIIPPFSIFDTRQGYWQDRKRAWSKLFDSQETREDVELIAKSGQSSAVYELRNKMRESLGRDPEWDEIIEYAKKKGLHIYEGASIFDPVLAEVCYRWFCPERGNILDPFAGGSVRGIVAGLCELEYFGIDLRQDQVIANIKQWQPLREGIDAQKVLWKEGDSSVVLDEVNDEFDFIFSCPPYHDLEQYSDDPADLSNMEYDEFARVYRSIITKSVGKLKQDRFACFVVGDIRDKNGMYRNFVSETIAAFRDSGMELYNEIILVNVAGSLPIRVGRQFENSRKVGKMHQNVLVFYKGDPSKIREEFPAIKIAESFLAGEEETGIIEPDGVERL